MAEEKVGVVKKFFAKPSVAAIEVTDGYISTGDMLWFKGYTTDFKEAVKSMELDNKPIDKAEPGQLIGIKVGERVREKDIVYKVVD